MIRIEELAYKAGVSAQTINRWYRWKKYNEGDLLASILPPYTQEGRRGTRYWEDSAVDALIKFKSCVVHGRNGVFNNYKEDKSGEEENRT